MLRAIGTSHQESTCDFTGIKLSGFGSAETVLIGDPCVEEGSHLHTFGEMAG